MKKRFYILILFTLLNLDGCIEPFEFESQPNEFHLVVDGTITQKSTEHKLFIGRTTGYHYSRRIHVSGAQVKLIDEEGRADIYSENIEGGYYYLTENSSKRTPGKTYHIEITLNNHTYRSKPQTMPGVMKADTLRARPGLVEELNESGQPVRKNYVNIFIETPVKKDNKDFYFLWRADEAYSFTELKCHPLVHPRICYIKRPVNTGEIRIFSSENLEGGILKDFLIARIRAFPVWEFYEKHFYNVAQHSITREAYEYWSVTKQIAQPEGSIFDTPPAPIRGNVYNEDNPEEVVLGYFEVSAVDTVRTYTQRQDLQPLVITDRCPWLNSETANDPPCCNCLTLENSDTERPYYWGQQ